MIWCYALTRSGNDATSRFSCCRQRFEGKFGNHGGTEDVNNEGMEGNGTRMHRDGCRRAKSPAQIPERKTGRSALASAAATGRKCKLAQRESNSPKEKIDSKKLENSRMKTVCASHWRELFSRQQFSWAERPLAQQG